MSSTFTKVSEQQRKYVLSHYETFLPRIKKPGSFYCPPLKASSSEDLDSSVTLLPSDPPVICLQCPISMKRQTIPVRTLSCTHVQTFDLSSAILSLNTQDFRTTVLVKARRADAEFSCPICCKSAPLYVDVPLSKALPTISSEVTSITIDEKGKVHHIKSKDAEDYHGKDPINIENSPEKKPWGRDQPTKPHDFTEVLEAFSTMQNKTIVGLLRSPIVSSPSLPSVVLNGQLPIASSEADPPRRVFSFRNLSSPVTGARRKRNERSRSPNRLCEKRSNHVAGVSSVARVGRLPSPPCRNSEWRARCCGRSPAPSLPPTPLANKRPNFRERCQGSLDRLRIGGPRYRRLSTVDLTVDSPC